MVNRKSSLAVVIPAFRVSAKIDDVIRSVPKIIDTIIIVDDACPENSGRIAEAVCDSRVIVIYRERNGGVGAAVKTGIKLALQNGAGIIIKADGDGQMDLSRIGELIRPLESDKADYSKGNRFRDLVAMSKMPRIRLIGNSILSFAVKVVSGYWTVMDPTNGFVAIKSEIVERMDLDSVSDDYFFEIDMLTRLNLADAVVEDVAMPAIYGDERSSMSISKVITSFPLRLLKRFAVRIFYKYYIYDFNMASIYMLLGVPLLAISGVYGVYEWWASYVSGDYRSPGTIMLVALPIIVGLQMIMSAISIDIANVPRKK